MEEVDTFLKKLDRPDHAKVKIARIVSTLKPEVLSDWLSKAKIVNRNIAGTYYAQVEKDLPSDDFTTLYEALGYDFKVEDTWKDWWCTNQGCKSQTGFSCNPDGCTSKT